VIIEKGCIANSIYNFPTFMTFFSTPELLEIGGIPFSTRGHEKPTRVDALEYFRRVAQSNHLNVRTYERVLGVQGSDGSFDVETTADKYQARKIVVATGFFDIPRMLNVPGESLPKVTHYYGDPHPYAGRDVLVVGSGNSAAIAAIECRTHGARVTLAVRSDRLHEEVKYWIRPDVDNRIASGEITAFFQTKVERIDTGSVRLVSKGGEAFDLPNDFVLAMTGYTPDFTFLRRLGVLIREDGRLTPHHDPTTYESNRPGLYLAGVVVGGLLTGKWSIENSRAHVPTIFDHLLTGLAR
jgi:thioredoxin reductase (NADPH)